MAICAEVTEIAETAPTIKTPHVQVLPLTAIAVTPLDRVVIDLHDFDGTLGHGPMLTYAPLSNDNS